MIQVLILIATIAAFSFGGPYLEKTGALVTPGDGALYASIVILVMTFLLWTTRDD